MNCGTLLLRSITPLSLLLSLTATAQIRTTFQRVQPGYANAIQWRWEVVETTQQPWSVPGFKPVETNPQKETPPSNGEKTTAKNARSVSTLPAGPYEVRRGDALAIIARKSSVPVDLLKSFNQLESDVIRIGQILKIPTPEEVIAMAPPRPPANAEPADETTKSKPTSAERPDSSPSSDPATDAIRLQVYLDRRHFPAGPIDGKPGATFEVLQQLYRNSRTVPLTNEDLQAEALRELPSPFTNYQLRHNDFQFIEPVVPGAKSAKPKSTPPPSKRRPGSPTTPPPAPQPIEDRHLGSFMPYATSWEFLAERFHCDESFLRGLNPKQTTPPAQGTFLKVPNVVPFEIERCLDTPIQPAADEATPVTAAVVDLSRLEIRKNEVLIAVMPLSRARPDLRGRGKWTVLQAIPGPAFATQRTPRNAPTENTDDTAKSAPTESQPTSTFTLPRGPRNPLGVMWIHLAKEGSNDPLPFGLHGTNIPSRMRSDESIGGFRLANWDIARAARLLPVGTPLSWLKKTDPICRK
jgi:LysM repeat protein/lipoprotein-anchoring transpeptidase ErfK/SrfK